MITISKVNIGVLLFICMKILFAAGSDTLWTKTYGGTDGDLGYAVQQTSDRGYIIVGTTWSFGVGQGDVYLIKTNANGDTLWTKTYGGVSDDCGYSVQQTSDGGYIITGYTTTPNNKDVYLIKTDSLGDALWTKTYMYFSSGSVPECGRAVQQTSDGGYIIAGWMTLFGYTDVWLLKTDMNGDTLWTKIYGISGVPDTGYSVQQTFDGGYIISCTYNDPGGNGLDVGLIKTDSIGNVLWIKTYDSGYSWNSDGGRFVRQTSDSGYIISGVAVEPDDIWLIKTDANGDTLWTKIYNSSLYEIGNSVQQTFDNGYIIVGSNFHVIKTNSNGDTLWTKYYGVPSQQIGYSGQQTLDGGYILAGGTISFGAGSWDVYLVKTKSEDTIPPIIESTTVWIDTSYIGSFKIQTKVFDNQTGIDLVFLIYKRDEDPNWIAQIMNSIGNSNWYLDSIPPVALPNDTVRYYIKAVDYAGNISTDPQSAPASYYWFIANYNSIAEIKMIPQFCSFNLKGNPNKDKAIFNLVIPREAKIMLSIFDVSGRFVNKLITYKMSPGTHEIYWSANVSAGVYFYLFESPWQKKMGKIIILR